MTRLKRISPGIGDKIRELEVFNMGFFDKARGKLKTPFQEGASLSAQSAWRVLPSWKKNGASLRMQALWKSLPEWKKNQLRRTLKDSDHDGVPDKFDCQPYNPRRQDYSDSDLVRELSQGRRDSNPIGNSSYDGYGTPMERSRRAAGKVYAAEEGDKYRRYEREAKFVRTQEPDANGNYSHYVPAQDETPYTEKDKWGGVRNEQVYGDQKRKKFLGIF